MNIKEYLEKLIRSKKDERDKLYKRIDESEDVKEIRGIGETLKTIAQEIADAEAQLQAIENEPEENNFSNMLHEYMREKLTPDEYLIFVTELDPPMFLKEKMKEAHGKLSTLNLIEYFELPKTQRAADYISNMRTHIKNTIKEAKEHFSKR